MIKYPPVPPTPSPPGIPREISLPAVTSVAEGGDHVPQLLCPPVVPPEPPESSAGDPADQLHGCGGKASLWIPP